MKKFICNVNWRKKLILTALILSFIFSTAACGGGAVHKSGENNNYGYTLLDGNDLYYTKIVIKDDLYYYSCLYKYNLKTKAETLININECDYPNEVNAFINIAGGDILFFTNYVADSSGGVSDNITKVKKSGLEPTSLLAKDAECSLMQVVGNDVYYYDESEQVIYKTDKNGKTPKAICEAATTSFFVQGTRIYYSEFDYIYAVSTSGGEPFVIYDASDEEFYIEQITYGNGYIYFTDFMQSSIRRVKASAKNATESEILYEVDPNKSGSIVRIYYYNKEVYFTLDRYGKDDYYYAVLAYDISTGKTRIVVSDAEDFIDVSPFSIWKDTLYFFAETIGESIMDSDYIWYTVPAAGGKATPFAPLCVSDDNFVLPGEEMPTVEEEDEEYEEDEEEAEEDTEEDTGEIDGE